jgi:nucleotide-binding universal stress UspA family protein
MSIATIISEERSPAGAREREDRLMDSIAVGVDGSASSRAALRWAINEARVHRAVLDVVHTWSPDFTPWASSLASGPVAASLEADLLVVGARGLGEIRGVFLGSVSLDRVSHAPVTVVVVRDGNPACEPTRIGS